MEIKEMIKRAKQTGADIEIVSTETEEGLMFYNLGGIGAILRWPIQSF